MPGPWQILGGARARSIIVVSVNEDPSIIPDDKNWTWVLEKVCIDCGFDASSFDSGLSGDRIRTLAGKWRSVLARADARRRPRESMWSPLEYGCHVRDVFRVFDERLELMLAEDEPQFQNWDQDKTALECDYRSQDPTAVASELESVASRLADRFDSVSSDQWERRGFRSDGTVFTVDTLARYLMHDPVHHLWDVGATAA